MEESCRFETGHVRGLTWNLNKILIKSERVRVVISIFCLSRSERLDEIRWRELLVIPYLALMEGKKENVLLKRYVFAVERRVSHFLNSKMK